MTEKEHLVSELNEAGYSVRRQDVLVTADFGDIHLTAKFSPSGYLVKGILWDGVDEITKVEYGTKKVERLVIAAWARTIAPSDETRNAY